eukprot:241171-Prymnesium_polylepis.2
MPLLRDGEHLIIINKVEDIMPTVQRLRANESLARAIGSAGRRLALEQLSMERGIRRVVLCASITPQTHTQHRPPFVPSDVRAPRELTSCSYCARASAAICDPSCRLTLACFKGL